jgi:hypothetical protein
LALTWFSRSGFFRGLLEDGYMVNVTLDTADKPVESEKWEAVAY